MLTMLHKNSNDTLMTIGSILATIMLAKAMYEQYLPHRWRETIHSYLWRYTERVVRFFSPYQNITFEEYTGERFNRSEMYTTIETYLSETTSMKARGLKASFVKDGKALVLGLGDNEEVTDEFNGIKVWWHARRNISKTQTITFYPGTSEARHYQLTFHGRHRKEVTEFYVPYVLEKGKAIEIQKRQRKLFTNVKESESYGYNSRSKSWSHVEFKHPATFDTLAMEAAKKQRIKNDLLRFKFSKTYYTRIGKPWKRGYLLYGPPGTGKSTMIVAMANYLKYDIYDLELTSVKDNTQLRKLLIETSSKSIIVIEDIDCSLDLTGQRSKKKKGDEETEEEKDPIKKKLEEGEKKKSEVTLSGLLNFIDGIWSACGEERLIIFTTNYIDKLDPALIRTGRMDMHIELSYCCYEAFKVLAKNYLARTEHPLFETIRMLLEETKMAPADVAEHLMPKGLSPQDKARLENLASTDVDEDENSVPEFSDLDVEICLENLIRALEKAKKDELELKAEEERQKQKAKVHELEEGSATLGEDEKKPKNKDKMEEGSTSNASLDKEETKN